MKRDRNYQGCLKCGSMSHYAKNLCRPCYVRFLRFGGNITEFLQFEAEKEKNKAEREQKKKEKIEKRMKILATSEFDRMPFNPATKAVWDWYYDGTEKYIFLEFDDRKKARKAYQSLYSMTKRRHKMNVKRYIRDNRVILERLSQAI